MATHQKNDCDPVDPHVWDEAKKRTAARVEEVFKSLEALPFLRPEDRREFRYFKRLFRISCDEIHARVLSGQIRPWSERGLTLLRTVSERDFPRKSRLMQSPARRGKTHKAADRQSKMGTAPSCLLLPAGPIRAGIFIGSFDPFQMTHIETALRFLARGDRPADMVFVVPEGSFSRLKPDRSEYGYRYDILFRQAADVFSPFIVPLDIGEGQDTIGIVRRLISLFAGRELSLTHILGSDMFPYAAKWYPQDLDAWVPAAKEFGVKLDLGVFVVKREKKDNTAPLARSVRKLGVPVQVDPKPIGTPSSTALREQGVFTIVFPTEAVLEKLEVVFRYGMNRHWMTERNGPDYEI